VALGVILLAMIVQLLTNIVSKINTNSSCKKKLHYFTKKTASTRSKARNSGTTKGDTE